MAHTRKLAASDYQEMQDPELWRAYHEGDREALGVLYLRHHRKLYAICYRYAKNKEVAEGMKQEVFLKILEKGKALAHLEIQQFDIWLKRFAYNLWIHNYRKQGNRQRILDNLIPFFQTAVEPLVAIDAKRIEECISAIQNERYRQLIVLTAQGYDNPTIAQLTGIEEAGVRKHKYEARKIFRGILEKEGLL